MSKAKIDRRGASGFQVTGDMTFETTRKLLTESMVLFREVGDMSLDLAQVGQVDSAGLALLLEWLIRAREKGRKVSLSSVPEPLLAIAHLCQVDTALEALAEK